MFSFAPLSDLEIEELQNENLLKEGIYPFIVRSYEVKTSQAGNEMIKLRLGILDENDKERSVFDYLVFTKKMMFKVKHFCETIGFTEEYAAGKFDPMKMVNKKGRAYISVQKGNAKEDGSGYYPDKNNIKDYVVDGEDNKKHAKEGGKDNFLNDDIGF